ncbi:MarR family transcriptional regulator [Cryobacterium sp. TMT2-18-3]|uniref:MarR family winged helix-turn-helix transcriptional regulator n=1 Tax=unclassified Cryobacterium TaxID=2649013 RepID=UPI00106D95EE|nr:MULTISPECIES: MarR family transcriptional regulator [unclassified Cryobacterium]TFC30527.1 MarR family transcriptional regulator [Cryobacterium sp. TMT2-18-2]TFC37148.1 MarR family transcriptional regulator [Cryobacterium sp. TMT2-42-4]TFC57783.1 MarR family transcriptional regulator [Cryobacterium sp. TMT2-15-1]TFC68255.1 MarR family transcriptional regulator [Cryobacterium sp. TMT2-18-3]
MFKENGSVQVLEGVAAAVVVLLRALDKTRAGMAAKDGFTGSEIRVLFRISEAGRVTPKILAGSTDLSMGAVTAISDRLVARDVVRRVANPDDRRSLFLELTATGETLMDSIYGDFRARIAEAQRKMSSPEQELLEAQLLNIAAALGYDLEEGLAGTQISVVKAS